MLHLRFIIRRIFRYVYRSARLCCRSRYRLPNLVVFLAVFYVISVVLTVSLVSPLRSKVWQLRDSVAFRKSRHPALEASLLPLPFQRDPDGPTRALSLRHDPRLVPALWLHSIRQQLQTSKLGLAAEVSVPFRWDTLLDLLPRVVSPPFAPANIDTCLGFRSAFHVACNTDEFCKEKRENRRIPGVPGIQITGPTDEGLDERARVFLGANYLMHLDFVPHRAVLLGVGPKKALGRLALVVPIANVPPVYQRLDIIALVEKYLAECPDCETISLQEQLLAVQSTWTESDTQVTFNDRFTTEWDALRLETGELVESVLLDKSDFSFSQNLLQRYFDARVHEQHTAGNNLDRQLALNLGLLNSQTTEKYFHEAQLVGTSRGSHFDWRFFKKSDYSRYEHQAILHRLTRAWLRFASLTGITTWLAHGSLLGWYWNGFNMPWDQDLDVQMTMESLFLLARNYNQSLVVDLSDESLLGGAHLYFVDVSPYVYEREHGDGKNVIDARFIDTDSGMYVDITGLAISNDFLTIFNESLAKAGRQLHDIFDPEYGNQIKSALDNPQQLTRYMFDLNGKESIEWESGRLYNCKNFHFYHMEELEPLKQTTFEGEHAYVPAKFEKILQREYRKGTTAQEYGDWIFRPYLGLWVHKKTCKNDYRGTDCHDPEVLLEEQFTRPMRFSRKSWFGREVLSLLRADTWMMQRNEELHTCDPK